MVLYLQQFAVNPVHRTRANLQMDIRRTFLHGSNKQFLEQFRVHIDFP
jgi:hypothetical protein